MSVEQVQAHNAGALPTVVDDHAKSTDVMTVTASADSVTRSEAAKVGDVANPNTGNSGASGNNRRKRRKNRRRWKPYHKLSLEEKRELEVRQQERAEKERADRFAHGQPMAPYNTTQFLLEDYEARQAEEAVADEVELHHRSGRMRTRSESYAGSDVSDAGSWPASAGGIGHSYDSSDSFEREFELEYEREQAERLQKLTRDDLIRENAQLCEELSKEKRETKRLKELVASLQGENQTLTGQMSGLEEDKEQQQPNDVTPIKID